MMKNTLLVKFEGRELFYENQEKDNINIIVDSLNRNQPNAAAYESLSVFSIFNGFKEWLFYENTDCLKQWFYLSSLLRAESCKYAGGWNMWTPHAFIFPLLTDHKELIKSYSVLTTVNDNDQHKSFKEAMNSPREGRFNVLRLQAVIKQDWEKVDAMEKIFKSKIKKIENFELWEMLFYQALRNKDINVAKDIIAQYLRPKVHQYLNQHLVEEFNGDIWSHHPVMFTKLAWMNGLEIEIDNPLVPMELMPVKPLDHYDYHYDFLEPNWKPKSFLDRLFSRK